MATIAGGFASVQQAAVGFLCSLFTGLRTFNASCWCCSRKFLLSLGYVALCADRRVVAEDAADPRRNFYVESPTVGLLTDKMRCHGIHLFLGPPQSGKTTDALAVFRRLHEKNIEVRHMLAVALLSASHLAIHLAACLSPPSAAVCVLAGPAESILGLRIGAGGLHRPEGHCSSYPHDWRSKGRSCLAGSADGAWLEQSPGRIQL